MINSKLKERWEILTQKLSTDFRDGDDIDLDSIIYLIGVQELQQIHSKFNKNQKLDLMHIAICKLLSDLFENSFKRNRTRTRICS